MIFFRRSPDYDPNWEMTLSMRFRNWTSGWRGAVVLFLLAATALGWWKGAEAYQWVKERKAEHLIADSEAARERGDFKELLEKLKQAMALLRHHPLTLRAVARYQIDMHDLSALDTYAELLKTDDATTADKVAFAREAFRLGRPDRGAAVLGELQEHPETRGTAAVLALDASRLAWEGRREEALKLARQACAAPGSDQDRDFVPEARRIGNVWVRAVALRLDVR